MSSDLSLTCKELVELITDYLEGKLSPEAQTRFESHLVGCSGCQRYMAQIQTTIRLVGQLRETDIAPEAQQELLAVFRHWKTERP